MEFSDGPPTVAIIGGGPAGLRAAEVLAEAGIQVHLFDQQPSVGRKFLLAGKGGLNLTHSEPFETFWKRYHPNPERWKSILEVFPPQALREWAHRLEIETYVGTSRRVYPVGNQAGKLLRRWVLRLKSLGVIFHLRHRWVGISAKREVTFDSPAGKVNKKFDAVILAMGGGTWPKTGSDARWVERFQEIDVSVTTLCPSNCGYSVAWPAWFIDKWEGKPLKNITVSFQDKEEGMQTIPGELLITKEGIEGTPIYHLARVLRKIERPEIFLDLKPEWSEAELLARWKKARGFLRDVDRSWKISPVAKALLTWVEPKRTPESWAARVKACPLPLESPRPLEEAISTAGGVSMEELNERLMIKKIPGVFCAGEMIDWEAPTGGYLLQGCFASGTVAGNGAKEFLRKHE